MRTQLTEQSERKLQVRIYPTPSKMFYVYVLQNYQTKKLYYEYTNNLKRRVAEHNREQNWELIYYEAYKSEGDARNREKRLKHYSQALTALKTRLTQSLN